MTYNVFGGTLNLAQSTLHCFHTCLYLKQPLLGYGRQFVICNLWVADHLSETAQNVPAYRVACCALR